MFALQTSEARNLLDWEQCRYCSRYWFRVTCRGSSSVETKWQTSCLTLCKPARNKEMQEITKLIFCIKVNQLLPQTNLEPVLGPAPLDSILTLREMVWSYRFYFSNVAGCSSMKETWWGTRGATVVKSAWGFYKGKREWTIDVPRPVSLTQHLAAGYWLFCVIKHGQAFWKGSTEQNKGWWDSWSKFPVGHLCQMMILPLSEQKKRKVLLSNTQRMSVSTAIYAIVHKVLEFVKDPFHIWLQSESLHEHNADGKGCLSRLNLKFISLGKQSADEPVVHMSIFRLITAPTKPRWAN